MTNTDYPQSVQALAVLSARLGADPLLIQAAGGNTSIKEQDVLWVKASGLWLRDAVARPSFVPVSLSRVRAGVEADDIDPVGPAALAHAAAQGLRPSIETTLHALMPHAVVLHVHSVDAIAWAVMPRERAALAQRLDGLAWAWIDYARPGLDLTRAAAEQARERSLDVLVMGNHGLVVGADTLAQAEERLADVVRRLRRTPRVAPQPDLAALRAAAGKGGWRLPLAPRSHAIATDAAALRHAAGGVLYPDHVVFLGHQLAQVPRSLAADADGLRDWLRSARAAEGAAPYLALPGLGVLLRDDLSQSAEAMVPCLADVLLRLDAGCEPLYIDADEAEGLANWEAEKFRKALLR